MLAQPENHLSSIQFGDCMMADSCVGMWWVQNIDLSRNLRRIVDQSHIVQILKILIKYRCWVSDFR